MMLFVFAASLSAAVAIIPIAADAGDGTAVDIAGDLNYDADLIMTFDINCLLDSATDHLEQGLMEFDISSIPAGSIINSADVTLFESVGVGGMISIYGYIGDGVVTVGDELASNHLATFMPGALTTVIIPPAFLQGLVNNGDSYAGFALKPGSDGDLYIFYGYPILPPVLTIDYTPVPEPSTVGLFVLGGIGLALYRRRK